MTQEQLYRRYADDVHRFAFWLSGNAAEAEDITSETFVRAWIGGGSLRAATVRAYLLAIARNTFLETRRKSPRRAELDVDLPDPGADPERQFEARSDIERVTTLLQQLPEKDRAALLMRVLEDMPYAEIADALGISVTAARVKVHRSRRKLVTAPDEEPERRRAR